MEFGRIDETTFSGFIYDPSDLPRRFVVDLWLDGMPIRVARAEGYVPHLAQEEIGDGCYGFSFILPEQLLADGRTVEARVANTQEIIGQPVALGAANAGSTDSRGPGGAEWAGGLRFRGWVDCPANESPMVRAIVDGEVAAEARASGFSQRGEIDNVKLAKAFDLHLPRSYADGRTHRVRFLTQDEMQLTAAPIAFVAFPDRLEQFFAGFAEAESERLRGNIFDKLWPASVPFTEYDGWRARWLPKHITDQGPDRTFDPPLAIILTGGDDEESSLSSLEDQRYSDWVAAALPTQDEPGSFNPQHLRDFLAADGRDAGIIVFASTGIRFAHDALERIANGFAEKPQARIVYCDIDVAGPDGSVWPLALPAFDYERMLEQGYCARLFAMARETLEAVLDTEPTNLYRLFNGAFDGPGAPAGDLVAHVPLALGRLSALNISAEARMLAQASHDHLLAREVQATVTPQHSAFFPAVRVSRPTQSRSLTVVIPVRNRKILLQSCLSSIGPALADIRAKILVVDNESSDADIIAYFDVLKRSGIQVLRVPGAFNIAHLNNVAVEATDSDDVLLLSSDVRPIDGHWLSELRARLSEPDVGAVGALLLSPSGLIRHGGIVLGPYFGAEHVGTDRLANDGGYADMLRVARECSAVTAACMLTRRHDYLAAGGLDAIRFPVTYSDLDYCLKLRGKGKRIIWTPHARLYHHGSARRGHEGKGETTPGFERELRNLRNKWGEQLIQDPYYNPNLALDAAPFSALAWPPRGFDARMNSPPTAVILPPGY